MAYLNQGTSQEFARSDCLSLEHTGVRIASNTTDSLTVPP